jgi:hypothetical protein
MTFAVQEMILRTANRTEANKALFVRGVKKHEMAHDGVAPYGSIVEMLPAR